MKGKRSLVKPRHRWEYNIEIDFQELGYGGIMDSIELTQDRDKWRTLLNASMSLRVP
jgi:hypothetical protein